MCHLLRAASLEAALQLSGPSIDVVLRFRSEHQVMHCRTARAATHLPRPRNFLKRGVAVDAADEPIGITALLGGHGAIAGKLKTRYEDFVVKEISRNGEIVESCPDSSISSEFQLLQSSTGKYARFVLAKENRDVKDAVAMLARHLRVDTRKISFHGLKDRRAITYQHISLPWVNLDPQLLGSCMSSATWDPAVRISNLSRQETHCRMGWLLGNDFCIVVRDAQPAPSRRVCRNSAGGSAGNIEVRSRVEKAVQNLSTVGFVNYFGRQRFGPSACSPRIGKAIACGQHEMACRYLVSSMREDAADYFDDLFVQRAFARALAETPSRCAIERRILQHLCASPRDFRGAIGLLPRQQRLLFVRSCASLLWNQVDYAQKPVN